MNDKDWLKIRQLEDRLTVVNKTIADMKCNLDEHDRPRMQALELLNQRRNKLTWEIGLLRHKVGGAAK